MATQQGKAEREPRDRFDVYLITCIVWMLVGAVSRQELSTKHGVIELNTALTDNSAGEAMMASRITDFSQAGETSQNRPIPAEGGPPQT